LHTEVFETECTVPGEQRWLLARENMRRYVAGEKMLSVIDMKRGY
jgi:hypothetical protein